MRFTKKIKCHREALRQVREFVKSSLKHSSLNQNDIYMLTLAVDEVCANLIIHSNKCDPRNHIQIELSFTTDMVEFTITDQQPGFDILNYNVPSLEELIKQKKAGGIGLILVKKIIDEIKISKGKKGEHICNMIKYHTPIISSPTESNELGKQSVTKNLAS